MSTKRMMSGRWYSSIRYKDAFGKVHQKKKQGFKTRREAVAWEREFIATHVGKAAPGLTFDALAQRFFADVAHYWRQSTLYRNKGIYRLHVQKTLGTMLVDNIQPATIRELHNSWSEAGCSNGSRQRYHRLISEIFNYGRQYLGLKTNPASLARQAYRITPREYTIWTQEQFEQFISRIPDESCRRGPKGFGFALRKIFYCLLFYGGFRRGEALALTRRDLNFEKNTIRINKSRGDFGVTEPKTPYSVRTVTMPRKVMDMLHDYISKLYCPARNDLIFPFSYGGLSNAWIFIQKEYGEGLPHIRLHDLRHSHASMLIHLGFTPDVVADRLGHKDASMVLKVYGHMYSTRRQEVADKLDVLLGDNED